MISSYFKDELSNLRELARAFSEQHPAVAPMLSGPSADPDVERLLEGVAFLTALLRERLDDEFPEIIHELIQLIWPHYLRPLPSTTVVAFKPKPALKQPMQLSAGVQLASVPVEGISCLFTTAYNVDLHPLSLEEASWVETTGRPPGIRLLFELRGMRLNDWNPRALRIHLAGDYGAAADLYLLLTRYVRRIHFRPLEGGTPAITRADSLKPVGFSQKETDQEELIPYPSNSFPGYRLLQEFFILPEKFLFLDLLGWEKWKDRGDGPRFEVLLELEKTPFSFPRINRENFVLFATPAINLFPHGADPIRMDHRSHEYRVRPAGKTEARSQVYQVNKVTGLVQGTAEKKDYSPFELFKPRSRTRPVYHLSVRRSPLERGLDVFLSVPYDRKSGIPVPETLSLDLLCTNGPLPERLQPGDIRNPTSTSPELAEFTNLRTPTRNVLPLLSTGETFPPRERNLLWRLLSHLSLNYLSLAKAENLKALLDLYLFADSRDQSSVTANKRRIDSIEKIDVKASDRLVDGIRMRGQEIVIGMRQDHFAGPGDLFLFGSVLDRFLSSYASIHTFTGLVIEETLKGDQYRWPAKMGDRPLI